MSLEQLSPLSETVKLISSDGFEFIVDRRTAMGSGTIKNMLSSPGIYILLYKDNLPNLYRTKSILEI